MAPNNAISKFIISLLGKMYMPAKLDPVRLKAGEEVLLVTTETRWKNVYKRTLLAFFQAFLPAFGLSVVLSLVLILYLFVTNIQQILNGTFGLPVPLLLAIGLTGFALVEVPMVVYRYHLEELNRRILKIIVTNLRVLVVGYILPSGYAVSSDTPMKEIKDVTSGPIGFRAADAEKLEAGVGMFDRFWAGLAYRVAKARTVNLPSALREATDSIQLDNAVGGFMNILASLVALAKEYDVLKTEMVTLKVRSRIQETLADLGVTVESHSTVADTAELEAAIALILNPKALPERGVDFLTLVDPGICNLVAGTIDLDVIRGTKPKSSGTAASPGAGFRKVARPGATV